APVQGALGPWRAGRGADGPLRSSVRPGALRAGYGPGTGPGPARSCRPAGAGAPGPGGWRAAVGGQHLCTRAAGAHALCRAGGAGAPGPGEGGTAVGGQHLCPPPPAPQPHLPAGGLRDGGRRRRGMGAGGGPAVGVGPVGAGGGGPRRQAVVRPVLLSGYYGFGNAGDEAILEMVVSALRTGAPDVPFRVLTADPEGTARRLVALGLLTAPEAHEAVAARGPLQALGEVARAGLLVSGAGGSSRKGPAAGASCTMWACSSGPAFWACPARSSHKGWGPSGGRPAAGSPAWPWPGPPCRCGTSPPAGSWRAWGSPPST